MTKLTDVVLNKHGWFYIGEPQVKTLYTKGDCWLKFRKDLSPTKGSNIDIGIKRGMFMIFSGWVNTEQEFLEVLRMIDLERFYK